MKKRIIGLLILTVFICFGCGGGGSGGVGDVGDSNEGNHNEDTEYSDPTIPKNVTITPVISRKAVSTTPYNTVNVISWDPVAGATSYNIYWNTTGAVTTSDTKITEVTSPYTHSNLTNGLDYYYIVTSLDGNEESGASEEVSSVPLAAPANVAATPGDTSNEISWDNVTGATSYNIYWLNTAGVTSGSVNILPGVTSPYIHTDLTNNSEYYYIVTALNGAGESDASAEISATPVIQLPSAPVNATATPGDASNEITWEEVTGATSYNIYWLNATGVAAGTGNKIETVTSPYTHEYLSNDLGYYYVVTAIDDNGEGAASIECSATPADLLPSVPGNVTATAGNKQNVITWDIVVGATTYNIYWETTTGVTTTSLNTSAVGINSFTHTPLSNFTGYYYIVTAVNADGEGLASSEVSATPVVLPTGVTATPDHNNNVISWTPDADATSYNIYWLNSTGVTTATGNIITNASTPYPHSNLTSGLDYFYIVTAVGLTVEGPASAEVSSMPISPPANVIAAAGNEQNVITWTNVPGATSYNISWNTTGSVTVGENVLTETSPYIHSGRTNNTKYYYIVTAVNNTEESFASSEISATPVAATVPANVTATAGDTENVITWDAVTGATTYNIYWDTTTGVTTASLNTSAVGTNSYPHPGLTNGNPYYYIVTAIVATIEGDASPEVSATPVAPPTAPVAPINISAAAGNTSNVITWDTVTGATSYNIYFNTAGSVAIGDNPTLGVTTPYTHTGLTNGSEYFYIVTAVNGTVEGVASSIVSATPVVRPAIPANITATAGDTENEITWDTVAGATSYNIYWLNNTGVTKLNGTSITAASAINSYTHTGLINGSEYFYIVTAVNDAGEGGASSEASATPAVPPSTLSIDAVTPGNTINVITWTPVPDTSYNIYWLTTSPVATDTGTKITGVTSPYTHSSLTNGTEYFYIITAENSFGESAASGEKSAIPVVAIPATPVNVTATPGIEQNVIIWDKVPGAISYNIYWLNTNGVTTGSTQIADVITTNSYTHTGLTNYLPYYYIVTSVNGTDESLASSEVTATPVVPLPSQPKNVTATPGNVKNIIIWDESDNATSYNVYWDFSPGVTTASPNKITDATSPYTHSGLVPKVMIYYIVTAVNGTGESRPSDEVSAAPLYKNPIADTGQDDCYDDLGTIIPCPSETELFYGQDANYTINPPSYSKLDETGFGLPFSAASWAMVRDNVTGRTWEVKTTDSGVHDKDNLYTWAEGQEFVNSLNTSNFGGYSDWRLPNVKELISIMDNSISAPSIHEGYFPNTIFTGDAYYWSSTKFAKIDSTYAEDYAWYVHFVYGFTKPEKRTWEYHVRAVRGGPD